MSVQRWKPSWAQGRMIPAGVHPVDGYVSAADHARIVAEATAEARAAERRHWEARFRNAEQAHAAALAEAVIDADTIPANLIDAWIEVGRKAAAPRTLTADDPEPAVGSVVLDKDGTAGQRVYHVYGVTTIWQFSDDDWCHEWGTVDRVRGPVTLIHDGGAA